MVKLVTTGSAAATTQLDGTTTASPVLKAIPIVNKSGNPATKLVTITNKVLTQGAGKKILASNAQVIPKVL